MCAKFPNIPPKVLIYSSSLYKLHCFIFRTTDEPNKFDDNTNEQKAESKGQKQNMKQSLGQNDYSELENQGKTYDEYGNEDDECKKANIKVFVVFFFLVIFVLSY